MKTIFRFLGLAVLAAVFTVAGGTSIFAQDTPAAPAAPGPCDNVEAREALETKVRTNFDNKDYKIRQLAVDAGEEYLKTYGTCEAQPIKDFITYLNGYLPPTKTWIAAERKRIELTSLFTRFDTALKNDAVTKAGNWDEVYSVGKQILALDPDNINILITLGSIGLDETAKTPRNTKYNNDTLNYAKTSIQKLNEGKTSKNLGVFQFAYKTKENALGWLNYTVGYITYFDKGDKKGALPFLYKGAYSGVDTKKLPQIYGILGDFYFDEVKRLGEEIRVKTVAANSAATPEAKTALIAETKVLIAQLKGYAERALDAYGRAKSLVPTTDARQKAYRDGLSGQIDTIYNLRFEKPDGLTEWVAAQVQKPLPDPTTVPAPIVEADPADVPAPGTATPGTAPGTKPVTPAAPGTAKPAVTPAANGTKPPATAPTTTKKPVSVNTTGDSSTTADAKPATRKRVVKKKGTR
jgi:hypothetical protein